MTLPPNQAQSPEPPDIREQSQFWNSWNAQHRESGKPLPQVNTRQARMVLDWVTDLRGADLRILEIGCGSGWLCGKLAVHGHITGIDLSDEVLDRSRAIYPQVTFIAGDFQHAVFPEEAFDVVVSLEVLAHVADQAAFIGKIAKLLRPGGALMLSTQNRPVLERWSQVVPQGAGQIRRWVDARTLRRLLHEEFRIQELTSIVPVGDRGLLRWTNAPKINRLLEAFASPERIEAVKERCFLGHTLMALATRATAEG